MYKPRIPTPTTIDINQATVGERLEEKIERITQNQEPITDNAPLIYTERKEGVQPSYDIRADKWDIAVDAMEKVSQTYKAKRDENIKAREEKKKQIEAKAKAEAALNTSDNQ